MSDTREPTLADAIGQAMDARIARVHTGMPARVEKIDVVANTVDVQPVLMDAIETTEGVEVDPFPQIAAVPIGFLRGGGYFVSVPIAVGDYVWLHSASRSIDQWLAKGGVVDPIDLRRHDINDVFAYPGVYPSGQPLADADPANMVIGKDGGPQIHISGTTVSLWQKNASDAVALASKVDARITALENAVIAFATAYNLHIHVTSNAVVGSPVIVAQTVAQATPPSAGSSTASTKVKAV